MNDDQDRPDASPGAADNGAVGNVAEEAAKLFGALSGWARDQAGEPVPAAHPHTSAAAHGLADALGSIVGNVNEHIATGAGDCRFCPVCQVIHAVRETNPEVRQQLSVTASSLLHAAAGLLATHAPGQGAPGVEKIDLSGDAPWDDER